MESVRNARRRIRRHFKNYPEEIPYFYGHSTMKSEKIFDMVFRHGSRKKKKDGTFYYEGSAYNFELNQTYNQKYQRELEKALKIGKLEKRYHQSLNTYQSKS